jgi:hypothetical protein
MKGARLKRALRRASGMPNAQAMTEFLLMGFVALIILFVAVQMAAIGWEYSALTQLNYQVTRWATNPVNNGLKDASANPVNSPQCSDVVNLIKSASVSPYQSATGATGLIGKVASLGVSCSSLPSAGIGVAMACTAADGSGGTSCATQRQPGVGVQITLTMNTCSILFLNLDKSCNNPNFLGIPFPKTLSSVQMMLTQ